MSKIPEHYTVTKRRTHSLRTEKTVPTRGRSARTYRSESSSDIQPEQHPEQQQLFAEQVKQEIDGNTNCHLTFRPELSPAQLSTSTHQPNRGQSSAPIQIAHNPVSYLRPWKSRLAGGSLRWSRACTRVRLRATQARQRTQASGSTDDRGTRS